MSGAIFLIVEDKTDADIIQAILNAKDIPIQVNPRTASNGGLSRLVNELPNLIATASRQCQPGDCIAILHDADEFVQPDRRLYEQIRQTCKQYGNVVEVIARDEIEAWLLADEGVCTWLGIQAANCDTMTRPSERLASLVKQKTRHNYSGANRGRLLSALNGTADKHSPSLQYALTHLSKPKRRRSTKS